MEVTMKLNAIQLDSAALSLSVSGDIDFDHFEVFAEPLARALDCRVRERQSVEREADVEVLEYLATLLTSHL